MTPDFTIAPAGAADLDAIRTLFRAYAASLPVDLSYQGFEAELAELPGKYAPPGGALLLASGDDGAAIGCVALRPLGEGTAEMKRLYVDPAARGLKLGKALAGAIIAEARRLGHRRIVLDSLPSMATAIGMYRAMGFVDVAPYYDTPVAGTAFLGLDLT